MRKGSNPIVGCVACLYRVGFGFTTIGKLTATNKSLCRKWVFKAGIHKGDRSKTFNKTHRHFQQVRTTKINGRRFSTEAIICAEYRSEATAASRPDRQWANHPKAVVFSKVKSQRKQRHHNPLYRAKFYARKRVREYCKLAGIAKRFSASALLGCTASTLKDHIERQFRAGMTWANHGKIWEIDHIVPLASATTEEEVRRLCHYLNLQPLTVCENRLKRDTMPRQGMLLYAAS